MKKLFSLLCAVLMTVGLLTATGVRAQAASSTARWQGVDVSQLSDGTHDVFLYNIVGTSCFLIPSGDYGTQGRLWRLFTCICCVGGINLYIGL